MVDSDSRVHWSAGGLGNGLVSRLARPASRMIACAPSGFWIAKAGEFPISLRVLHGDGGEVIQVVIAM